MSSFTWNRKGLCRYTYLHLFVYKRNISLVSKVYVRYSWKNIYIWILDISNLSIYYQQDVFLVSLLVSFVLMWMSLRQDNYQQYTITPVKVTELYRELHIGRPKNRKFTCVFETWTWCAFLNSRLFVNSGSTS